MRCVYRFDSQLVLVRGLFVLDQLVFVSKIVEQIMHLAHHSLYPRAAVSPFWASSAWQGERGSDSKTDLHCESKTIKSLPLETVRPFMPAAQVSPTYRNPSLVDTLLYGAPNEIF